MGLGEFARDWNVSTLALYSNIAAARAVDREFNYNFGSNLGLFGCGRGLNGRGAPAGSVWAEFQLKWSRGAPFHAQTFFLQVVPTRERRGARKCPLWLLGLL